MFHHSTGSRIAISSPFFVIECFCVEVVQILENEVRLSALRQFRCSLGGWPVVSELFLLFESCFRVR
jgi:hypothetical protein